MPSGRPPDSKRPRVILILGAIIDAGGEAGTREIWLRVNRGQHALTIRQVSAILAVMAERGHVRPERDGRAFIWQITPLGREWLRNQKGK